jgi:Leucine-rich repeat (LRR) protein
VRDEARKTLATLLVFAALAAGCQDVSFHLALRPAEDGGAGSSAIAGAAGSVGGAGLGTGGAAGSPRDAGAETGEAMGAGGGAGAAPGGTAGSGPSVQAICSDPLAFADPDIEPFVRQAIGLPSGPIHPADVAGLTGLDLFFAAVPDNVSSLDYSAPPVADGWITSLVGVECLTSLEKLAMDPIDIDLGPLAQLPHLTELDFGPMIETTLPRLPQITTLVGPGPRFGASAGADNMAAVLRAFPSLESLDIEGNFGAPDAGPALSALTNLTHLEVDQCSGLNATDLEPLTNLTDLSLSTCGLTDSLFLGYLTQLTSLDLSGNILQDITSISDCAQLTVLDLSGNVVRDVSPLVWNVQLTSLNLDGDVVRDISPLSGLTKLATLHLSGNVIQDLSPLSKLTDLTDIDLSKNLIVDLSPLVANPGIGAGDLLDVSSNQLDCTKQRQNIATLRQRGVTLSTDCL